MINSEPHVAVTRGLNTSHVGPEHALSSFADLQSAGFGRHQHHMWIPVKDLWYSFPMTPPYPRGVHGHENEWLFTHGGERYQAEPDDVHTSWANELDPLHFRPEGDIVADDLPQLPYDTMPPDVIDSNASEMTLDQLHVLHARGRMGPLAYKEFRRRGGAAQAISDLPYMPNREATELAIHQLEMGDKSILALHNPNLTSGDLVNIVNQPNFIPERDVGQEKFASYLRSITKNPAFNSDVGDLLMEQIVDRDLHNHAILMAQQSPVPLKELHRYFLGALGAGDTVNWSPEFAIANAFNDKDAPDPKKVPSAFNNSVTTEQYLRALTHHFEQNPDDSDEASNVYHRMLTGARMSESTVASLTDQFLSGNPLEGTSMEEYGELLEDVARFNPQLSPRAMLHFARFEEGRMGLLKRPWLPEGVQLELADKVNDETQVGLLVERADLVPSVADSIISHVSDLNGQIVEEDDLRWIGRHLAGNYAIPMSTLEKHMTKDAKEIAAKFMDEDEVPISILGGISPFERGLLHGIFWRKQAGGQQHIVHALPPGAAS
jgi:hypothetical protein